MGKIRIEVDSISCRRSEGLLTGDDLYYLSTLRVGEPEEREEAEGMIRDDLPDSRESSRILIAKGETKTFPGMERILYQVAGIDREEAVVGSVYWFDDDQGTLDKDLYDRIMFISLSLVCLGLGWLFLFIGGMPGSALGIIGGIAGIAVMSFLLLWVAGQTFYHKVMNSTRYIDKDDFLGGRWFCIPAHGPLEEEMSFKIEGSKTGIESRMGKHYTKSWKTDYTVNLKITRILD